MRPPAFVFIFYTKMAVVPEDKPVLQTKPFWLESGLSEYTNSENPGFKAALKVLPEDFVVTELNSEGELVVLDNYETPEGRGCESLALSTRKRKVKENYLAPTLRDEVTPLQEMITNEQYRALEEMATSYKQSLTPDPIHLVNLGILKILFDASTSHIYASTVKQIFITHLRVDPLPSAVKEIMRSIERVVKN